MLFAILTSIDGAIGAAGGDARPTRRHPGRDLLQGLADGGAPPSCTTNKATPMSFCTAVGNCLKSLAEASQKRGRRADFRSEFISIWGIISSLKASAKSLVPTARENPRDDRIEHLAHNLCIASSCARGDVKGMIGVADEMQRGALAHQLRHGGNQVRVRQQVAGSLLKTASARAPLRDAWRALIRWLLGPMQRKAKKDQAEHSGEHQTRPGPARSCGAPKDLPPAKWASAGASSLASAAAARTPSLARAGEKTRGRGPPRSMYGNWTAQSGRCRARRNFVATACRNGCVIPAPAPCASRSAARALAGGARSRPETLCASSTLMVTGSGCERLICFRRRWCNHDGPATLSEERRQTATGLRHQAI